MDMVFYWIIIGAIIGTLLFTREFIAGIEAMIVMYFARKLRTSKKNPRKS